MEQPNGSELRLNAPADIRALPISEWSQHDLIDLNGTHVRQIEHDAAIPENSMVAYAGGATLSFAQIARIIPCFTAGTLIATPDGEKPAEALRAGDRVLTRDNGLQMVTWAGQKKMTMQGLSLTPDMRPVRIRKEALGPNCPERDMVVSPNHRMLMVADKKRNLFGESELLLAAKNMTHLPGVDAVQCADVTYIHFMCTRHEIVFSDGAWTETFQPNDDSLHGIDAAQRNELLTLFPDLATSAGRATYRPARKVLPKSEAALLV